MYSMQNQQLIYEDLETDNFAFVYTENVIIDRTIFAGSRTATAKIQSGYCDWNCCWL